MRKITISLCIVLLLFVATIGLLHILSGPAYAKESICEKHFGECPIHLTKCAGTTACKCYFYNTCVAKN